MSQIDQAFIQAYNAPESLGTVTQTGPVPFGPTSQPAVSQHGPHFPLPADTQQAAPAKLQPASQVHAPVAEQVAAAPSVQQAPATHTIHTGSPAVGRRPLSTFSTPEPPTTAFAPMFEVDAFRWPKLVDDMLAEYHQLLIPTADQLLDASEQGRSLVGIAGTRSNVGCSTVLMCLGRLIASVGKSVALVDANFAKASLGRNLGLEFEVGWEHALAGQLPLAECVVKSLQDRMTLLPLAQPHHDAGPLLEGIQTSVTAGVLRYHYDVVLFNMGAAAATPQDWPAHYVMQNCRLDAGIIVADTERIGIDPVDTLFALFGRTCLGVIGNGAVA